MPQAPEGKFCPLCTPTLSFTPTLTLTPTPNPQPSPNPIPTPTPTPNHNPSPSPRPPQLPPQIAPPGSPPNSPLLDPPPHRYSRNPLPPGGIQPTVSWGGSPRPNPRGRPPKGRPVGIRVSAISALIRLLNGADCRFSTCTAQPVHTCLFFSVFKWPPHWSGGGHLNWHPLEWVGDSDESAFSLESVACCLLIARQHRNTGSETVVLP